MPKSEKRYGKLEHSPPNVVLHTVCVTDLRKIRPLRCKEFTVLLELVVGMLGGIRALPLFQMELFLPTFGFPFGRMRTSLQKMIIFSNRNTRYSRSMLDLFTTTISSSRSSPKLARLWPFQSSTRCGSILTVATLRARRSASLHFSTIRSHAATPSTSSP